MLKRKINIYKCTNCGKEILVGETCCGNISLVNTDKKKELIIPEEKQNYFEQINQIYKRNWFYISHYGR